MENVNAKYPVTIPDLVDLVTIDVSFISAEKVIPAAENILKDHGRLIVLIKPQFEALRREVGKGGVIREPDVHARVLARFITWVTNRGLRLGGLITSPIEGAAGNREFLILLSR
jgi:23S rRNA (cytidine1920-2'-O)/16S rRNA (cytidine1409-2'-O)-methyltransferase